MPIVSCFLYPYSQTANQDIYDDLKLKKPSVSVVYTKISPEHSSINLITNKIKHPVHKPYPPPPPVIENPLLTGRSFKSTDESHTFVMIRDILTLKT